MCCVDVITIGDEKASEVVADGGRMHYKGYGKQSKKGKTEVHYGNGGKKSHRGEKAALVAA
jgi:hypothetical protein